MANQSKKYQTQWAAQFYAAAELTRRGYLVSLTFGNAPVVDLLVVSPNGKHFMVDVKGQSTKNFWLIQGREPDDDLFYILVYLSTKNDYPDYFIISGSELMLKRNEYNEYKEHINAKSGKYRDDLGGINWSTCLPYKDKWENLPK
jgi:hypothetical protein